MKSSRRTFMTASLPILSGAGLSTAWTSKASQQAPTSEAQKPSFKLFPIGRVQKQGQTISILVFDEYLDGLLGMEDWSHLHVLYWFDQNDNPEKRAILRVHPRANDKNPLTGVFACRSPMRPNLIALSVCKILSVERNLIHLDRLDAFDGSPVLDLKPVLPSDTPAEDVRVPKWARSPD